MSRLYDDTARLREPIVITKINPGPRQLIGFEDRFDSGIEIVKAVTAEELRQTRQIHQDQKDGKL